MAVMLGKRKRAEVKSEKAQKRTPIGSPEPSDSEDLRDAFRRAFEAKFKPLAGSKKPQPKAPEPTKESEDQDECGDEEWEGISEEEGNQVEVVEVSDPTRSERASRDELKAFMSSKPPSSLAPSASKKKHTTDTSNSDDDADADAANLKNDLALQRLLKESHLLAPNDSTLTGPTGKNRHKAMDLRIQALGSKTSLLQQEKMPLSHRKGITLKANEREEKRRREAKENGIILEKATAKKVEVKKRVRGVGGPGVGRFSGGMLKLSKRDVASITGGGKGKRR